MRSGLFPATVWAYAPETGIITCTIPQLFGTAHVQIEPYLSNGADLTTMTEPVNGDVVLVYFQGNDDSLPRWLPRFGGTGGDASTADKWTTARTVTFATGDVTGNFTIDGSADVNNVPLSITAATVLAKLLTVDGAGSGLDADLLDGLSSADFSTASHNHDSDYLNTAGDTATGTITMRAGGTGGSTAPIKFQNGAKMSTPEANAFEYDGTQLWMTSNGGVRKQIAYTDSIGSVVNADKWTTARTVTFSGGDVTGTFTIDGSADVTGVVLTVAANSVVLGTDTTGNYIATIAGTTNQVSVSGSGSETAAVTLSLPQDIHSGASPSFVRLTLTQGAGTAPLTVSSNTVVANLNADLLDGQEGSFYSNWANITNKPDPVITLAGDATGNVTLTDLGNGTLTVAVVDDSHLHDSRYLQLTGGTVGGNLTVSGDLVVNGTTVTVNSTTVTLDDPIITLGGDTPPISDDSKDRGVEFRWHTGAGAKVGFFGFDDSTGKFTFIPDATNTAEVFSGTKGTLDAFLDWADILNKPDPVVTVTLTGDVTGSGNATLTDVGNATISFATTVALNSVALGTDTTGNYIATITGTTNQVNVAGSGSETAGVTLSLPQDIHTAAVPTFSRLTLSQTTGTAPLAITSQTVVTNLNADLLDGLNAADFATDAELEAVLGDLMYVGLYDPRAATITNRVLTTNVVTITTSLAHGYQADQVVAIRLGKHAVVNKALTSNVATLTTAATHDLATNDVVIVEDVDATFNGTYTVTGTPSGTTFTYAKVAGNVTSVATDGIAAHAAFYGNKTIASTPTGTTFTYAYTHANITTAVVDGISFKMPMPVWSGGSTVYRHAMYWIVNNPGIVDFIDTDLSGRLNDEYEQDAELYSGDWVISSYPGHDPNNPGVDLTLSQIVFQAIPFSSETLINQRFAQHIEDPNDPHAAAGYLTVAKADPLYSPLIHSHAAEIGAAIATHEAAADPHPNYLLEADAAALYSPLAHNHDGRYELAGAIAAHEAATDPHAQYLTTSEADAAYAQKVHLHDDRYSLIDHVHPADEELLSTDSAPSSRAYVGDVTPSPQPGDLWFECDNIGSQPPGAPTNLVASATATVVTLTWNAWSTTPSSITLDRGTDGVTYATNIPVSPASLTTIADTGRSENTHYYYRMRATNGIGTGPYSYVDITTPNAAPGPPTALTTATIVDNAITLSWTAPSPFPDPATNRYEVFKNGTSQGVLNTTSYNFTGLSENTTYTLGVRALDTGGLASTTAALNNANTTPGLNGGTKTANANPPAPTGSAASLVTHNSARLSWNAVTTISDLQRYKTYKDDVFVANTTNTFYDFTGLTPSTSYKLEVRTEDTAGALSTDNAAFVNQTTSVNPDTTPPANATVVSFKPEGSYGVMILRWTYPADTDLNLVTIERSLDGSSWTQDGSTINAVGLEGTSGNRTLNSGSAYAAGQTVYARIKVKDDNGNERTGSAQSYTLIASPSYVTADATNSWRNTNGGQYNVAGNNRPYQGYFDTPAWNAIGLWYYGTKPQTQVYNSGRRTFTLIRMLFVRSTAGSSAGMAPVIQLHAETASPGTVAGVGAPTLYESETSTGLSLTTPAGAGETGYYTFPAPYDANNWGIKILNGTRRGVAVRDTSSPVYANFASVGDNGFTGLLEFTHYG